MKRPIEHYMKIMDSMGVGRYAPAGGEVLYHPLYDTLGFSGAKILDFFSVPIGVSGKTELDTNMFLANKLPRGNTFIVCDVQVFFIPKYNTRKAPEPDVLDLLGAGMLTLQVADRIYLQMAPLAAMPPAFPMYWAADPEKLKAMLAASPMTPEGEMIKKTGAATFDITPTVIESSYFRVKVDLSNLPRHDISGRLGVILGGYLFRPNE